MRKCDSLIIYADGAIGDGHTVTGIGAVILDTQGHILKWRNRKLRRMTNNEAEYAGLILALEMAIPLQPGKLQINLDSEVVVGQMNGVFSVNAKSLRPWHRQACHLSRKLPQVTYQHIPREYNRLADALANEALIGKIHESI